MRYCPFLIEFFHHLNTPYQTFIIKLYVKYTVA